MKISEAFPSKHVAAHELHGQDVDVVMGQVVMEESDEEAYPVLYFQGMQKGLRLNKTNGTTIASMYGDDTDHWVGRAITIFPTQTEMRGKQVACIRVRITPPAGFASLPQPQPQTQPASPPQQAGVSF